jgi:hypothetical protein
MKKVISTSLAFSLIVLNSLVCVAQTDDPCKKLRNDVQRMEAAHTENFTPAVYKVYKEALLKAYKELANCLEHKLSAATETEVASLRAEKAATEDKIHFFEIAVRPSEVSSHQNPGPARPVLTDAEPATPSMQPASSALVVMESINGNGNGTSSASTAQPLTSTAATPTSTPVATAAPQADDPCKDVQPGKTYDNPPPILSALVNRSAADVANDDDPDFAVASLSQIVLYTIFDAASAKSSTMLRELEDYQYLSETARTDKQLGPAPNSEGAVSAIEKPSFARLLGFAIEHGGITKKNDGTNLTLSTSLYSLYAMTGGDTAERYQEAGFLNRVGVAATFAIADQNDELANVRRNNLSEWSAKVRLFGDRSTRSARFQEFWDSKVRPLIRARLLALGHSVESLSKQLKDYDKIERLSRRCLPGLAAQRMAQADYKAAGKDEQKRIIADLILQHLRANIFSQVRDDNGKLKLSDEQRGEIEGDFLPRLKTALDNLVLADAAVKKEIADLQKGPLATFAFTNYRIPTGSDYSETKFLFEQDKGLFRPLKLVGNVGMTFYNKPDPLLNQKRVRDFSAALSFEGSSRSPFTEDENRSRITYSFVGRYQRLFENRRLLVRKPDIGAFQFVMEVPFFRGLSLPLSATYANATEEEKKNHFRFNFGMRLDTDKLFELLRAASNR